MLGYIPPGPARVRRPDRLARARRGRRSRGSARRLGLSTLETARGIHDLANARDDARAPRRLDREGPRPGRLRARRLRRLRARSTRPRSRPSSASRTAIVPPLAGPLLRRRPAVRAGRVPRRPLLPGERARARPRRARRASTPRCASRSTAAIGGEAVEWQRVADVRYRGQNWSVPIELPGRARRGGARRARRAVRGRARAALRHAARAGLAGRHPGAAADRARARAREPFSLPRGPERDAGRATRRADFGPRARHARGAGRRAARRSAPSRRPGPLLVDEYDTTVVVPPGWTVRLDAGTRRARARRSSPPSARRRRAHADAIARAPRRERARDRRRRDGDHDLPHRALGGRPRRDGLLGRALRPDRRDGRAGGHDPAPARLDPERDAHAARALRRHASAPGDVYIVNDPFDGASHTPDVFVVKPSFLGETLLGFAVTVAHHGDIGGRVPGLVRLRQHRGLPGGAAPAVDAALRRGRAVRGAVRHPPRERAHPARAARRPRAPRSPPATSATARCRSSPAATAPSGSAR